MKKSIWIWAMVGLIALISLIVCNAETRAEDVYQLGWHVSLTGNSYEVEAVTFEALTATRVKIKGQWVRQRDYSNFYTLSRLEAEKALRERIKKDIPALEKQMEAARYGWKTISGGKEWGSE